jgi:oligopeptide transport system permease protein
VHFLTKRFLQALVAFIGTTLLVFLAVFALPGDPIQALAGDSGLGEAAERALREKYNLDQPILVQYWYYVSGLFQGNFGVTVGGEQVGTILARAWPITLQLGLTAWLLEIILGVGLGTLAALRPGGILDRFVLAATVLSLAVPTFVFAFFMQQILAIQLDLFPVAGVSQGWPVAYLLPALCLAALGFGPVARLTRTSVLSTVSADFVVTARSKGITPFRLNTQHVLRNALVPVVTYLGLDLGGLLGGSVVIEGIFNIPGVGGQLFSGISSQQGTIVVGIVSALVIVAIVINLLVELVHRLLDPRIATND